MSGPVVTPDTASYYHVAYTVAALIYVAYVASLWRRWRHVRRASIFKG